MSLSKEDAYYRRLADYEQVVEPEHIRLKNVDWQLVRGLILKRWRQVNAELIRAFFQRQQEPEYLSCRHLLTKYNPNPCGGYPSRLVYLPHDFQPISHYCPLALDRTRRALHSTFTRGRRNERALIEAETYYHYNNPFARLFPEFGYLSGQPVKAWGREEMEAAWQRRAPDVRAFMAEHLNKVAQFLSKDEGLAILLEPGAPRLARLSGEDALLGYVAYFFDCWQHFHEYEQAAPAATTLADAGTVESKLTLRQVALLYVYTGQVIPPSADAIAQQYGHASGRTLYKRYLAVMQRNGRVGEDIQGKVLVPMLADITAVIQHLTGPHRQQAENERQTLEARK
jgi:hypothetical protein